MSTCNYPRTPSISELWKAFEQRYSSGPPGAAKGVPELSGARLESARREWVTELKRQVWLGCPSFSWPATPEDVGALKNLLKWDAVGLWREVNGTFSVSAQDSNFERPDPANTSYRTWRAEEMQHKIYQGHAFHSPSPKSKSKTCCQCPDDKKPRSNTNNKEEFGKDKPFSVRSFPRLYAFTPKWPHKIWTLDDSDSKLKRFALKKWIYLMREFNAMSLDYGKDAMHQLLSVRSEESAEQVFSRWDRYLQLLADKLHEDWENAFRRWPKGDDNSDETVSSVSTSATESDIDTDSFQTPTAATTPVVQEMKERNRYPLILQKYFARSQANIRPAERTKGRWWHDRQSKRKCRKRETPWYSKKHVHRESDGSSTEDDEILCCRGRQSHASVQPNRRTDDDFFQAVVEDKGRTYPMCSSIKTAPMTPPVPSSSRQGVPNEASKRGTLSFGTPKNNIHRPPPLIPLPTKPFSRPKISYPSMPDQLSSTHYWSRSGIPQHTIRDTAREQSDRHNALPSTESTWVKCDAGRSDVLDPNTEAEIEMMYPNVARNAERNPNTHTFQKTGIYTYSPMEEGHKLYGHCKIDMEGVSGEDTMSNYEVTSEDDAKSWRVPPTCVKKNFGNPKDATRPAFRAPDRRESLASGPSKPRDKEKAVRWDPRPADIRYY